MDWQPFDGGPCPVAPRVLFDTKHRDGSVTYARTAYPGDQWRHLGTPCDIVAYRLRPAPPAAKPGE